MDTQGSWASYSELYTVHTYMKCLNSIKTPFLGGIDLFRMGVFSVLIGVPPEWSSITNCRFLWPGAVLNPWDSHIPGRNQSEFGELQKLGVKPKDKRLMSTQTQGPQICCKWRSFVGNQKKCQIKSEGIMKPQSQSLGRDSTDSWS